MNKPVLNRSLAVLAVVGLALASCGDDDDDNGATGTTGGTEASDTTTPGPATTAGGADTTGAGPETTGGGPETTGGGPETTGGGPETTGGGAAVDLASVCPDPIVIQTDWFPESEHGALYNLVGEGYEVDVDQQVVSGPLVAGGQDTGVNIEIRTGGPAIGDQTVAAVAYADESITLVYANTEAQVLQDDETPLISVMAPLEINPQIIYWDPETYPEVETLADLGEENITINVFGGGVFSEVFVGNGTWNADQVDPSYDGSPARFVAEDGAIAQQGFASAEPFTYENVFEEWGKPVKYQLLHDAGFQVYSQTLSVREADLEELRPCLEQLIPIIQQSAIDFVNDPARANAIIIDAVAQYDSFWVYDEPLAEYSVETQRELGLVGNGPDDTLGNMEESRIQTVIDQMRDDAGLDVPADLVAADLFTNEFIDPDIGL
jgi:hypothetical protein